MSAPLASGAGKVLAISSSSQARAHDLSVSGEQLGAWTAELTRTEVAQPAICLASLLWKKHLERLGIEPVAVGGHSLGELSAFCAAGAFDEQTLLRLAAIRGRAMAARPGRPGAMASLACPPEIADPSRRDERILRQNLDDLCEAFRIRTPEPALAYMPHLHELPKHARHERELPVLVRAAQAAMPGGKSSRRTLRIRWLDSGKPVLEGDATGQLEMSLSHDDQTLLCVAGPGSQGCDVHPVQPRGRRDWIALLSKAQVALLDELAGGGDSLDRAGTCVWSASQAVRKATGAREVELEAVWVTRDAQGRPAAAPLPEDLVELLVGEEEKDQREAALAGDLN